MFKSMVVGVGMLAAVVGCNSHCKNCDTDKQTKMSDAMFFNTAAGANQTEVDMSKLALTHSQDADIKAFAQKMIDDHTMANQKLAAYASTKGGSLPTTLDDKHQAMVNQLSTMSGPDFNRSFLQDQVAAHQETIDAFKSEEMNGEDPDSQNFAKQMLPTLQMHLDMAMKLQKATPYVQPTM